MQDCSLQFSISCFGQPNINYSVNGASTISLGRLFHSLVGISVKMFSLMFRISVYFHNLIPSLLVISQCNASFFFKFTSSKCKKTDSAELQPFYLFAFWGSTFAQTTQMRRALWKENCAFWIGYTGTVPVHLHNWIWSSRYSLVFYEEVKEEFVLPWKQFRYNFFIERKVWNMKQMA